MSSEDLDEQLEAVIASGASLREIVPTLQEYRRLGISREEVQKALESFRGRAPDEETEDRILEVMDIVSGFCARESTVWED